jgi:hypothetical protein
MPKTGSSLYRKIFHKLSWNFRFFFRSRNKTIYHCCIQKTASQWFRQVLNDPLIWRSNKLLHYSPSENFITEDDEILKKLNNLPTGVIASPLYIRFPDFFAMKKPGAYKAFFVSRDPRDLIVSNYFSLKYSHKLYHPYIIEMRKKLNSMSLNDGVADIISSSTAGIKKTIEGWTNQDSDNIRLVKYEDIFGVHQQKVFADLMKHCDINLSDSVIKLILKKYSFKNMTGRAQGSEDVKSHYRKGIAGDWKNYFTDGHKELFKSLCGDLLIKSGYEKDHSW